MSSKQAVIMAIYAQLGAPDWAAANLDALADVLRDLSWLPEGAVDVTLPELAGLAAPDRRALLNVLARAVQDSGASPRPVRIQQ